MPRRLAPVGQRPFWKTSEVIAALTRLEPGPAIPTSSMLCGWHETGLCQASVRPRLAGPGQKGGTRSRLYNLDDLHRIRLIVRLRNAGVSMPRVRVVMAHIEARWADVLRPTSQAVLVVDHTYRVAIEEPGKPAVEIPSAQIRLPFAELCVDAEEVSRIVLAAA